MEDPFELDPLGSYELKVYLNTEKDKIYCLPDDDHEPENCTYVETVKARGAKKNGKKLQVCYLPKQPEFDFHSLLLIFNDDFKQFYNRKTINTEQKCIIVAGKSKNI